MRTCGEGALRPECSLCSERDSIYSPADRDGMKTENNDIPTATRRLAVAAIAALGPVAGLAQTMDTAPPRVEDDVVVFGRWDNPIGQSVTASQGVVGAAELDSRPRMRTGEILEATRPRRVGRTRFAPRSARASIATTST
jgi:hypothetical protein